MGQSWQSWEPKPTAPPATAYRPAGCHGVVQTGSRIRRKSVAPTAQFLKVPSSCGTVTLSARACYLVHVGEDGAVILPYTQAKQILDTLKRLCLGRDLPDAGACARFDRATRQGEDMRAAQRLLSAAVASVVGRTEERAVASLFSPGGTHAMKREFAGINDFEVVAFLVVLSGETP